jgi:hypothetical protein
MRKWIGLLALLSLLAPLAAFAGTSAPPSAPKAAIAVDSILSPQELATSASPSIKLDGFFQSMSSGSSGQSPRVFRVCSISCAVCSGSCPAGAGVCSTAGCLR